MSLFASLNTAGQALGVVRAQHATASHNIENATTPGFARQRANVAANQPATATNGSLIGTGVALGSITQVRDRFLDAQVPAVLASSEFSGAASATVTTISTLDPDDDFGLPASLGNFYAALRQLSVTPSDPSYRRVALSSAEAFAQSVRRSAEDIDAARVAADAELTSQLGEANNLAERVASLNAQVRATQSTGVPNDLLDQRRLAAEQLAGLTGARISDQDGDLLIQVGGTALVVGDTNARFSTAANGANRGHLSLVVTGTDGGVTTLQNDEIGGRLGGVLHGRDAGLGAVEARLDDFAFEFTAAINTVHAGNLALDGSGGRGLFVNGVREGAAGRLRVETAITANPSLLAASASGAPGDNAGALALIATERTTLASGANPASTLATLIGDFGSAARAAIDDASAAASTVKHIVGLRESASGVSIDEELVELTKAQRAFEAVSKVLQSADEMLGNLLAIIR